MTIAPENMPHRLWAKAEAEFPDDEDARRERYRELMIEAGNLIPGKPKNLPCGWPHLEES